jgi:hypothetical protein
MEVIVLLAIAVVVGIPAIAIVALVRTNSTRKLLEDYAYKTIDLQEEIAKLRRELALLTKQVDRQSTLATPASLDAQVRAPEQAQEPVLSSTEPAIPKPVPGPAAVEAAPVFQPAPVPPSPVAQPIVPIVKQPEPVRKDPQFDFAATAAPVISVQESAKPADTPSSQFVPPPSPKPLYAEEPLHASTRTKTPSLASFEPAPPRIGFSERLRATLPLEEVLGMNLFAKIGIVLLVLGFALLGRVALVSMGPGARVVLIYAVAAAMLAGGIWLENRERYRLVGRTGIGGGWALLFFTTYAMYHVQAMAILSSNTLDCILMLAVAIAMVVHTLRYKSQLVTGLAFLLAFSTVALSQDSVYALAAGVILALGIVTIALRMSWFELEVFGIIASFANHFYWLYKLYPDGVAGHPFPQFWPSAIILVLYWAVFRTSYIVRRIRTPRDESISTIAALLNTMFLLAVLKFQATHPEWAFCALLALGALEFFFGQLPISRRRRPAFVLLTVIGTLLVFASVPFKFSGNNIALFWMIAAEALLIAGIVQLEPLFRRLGVLAGVITGLLITYEARSILEIRQQSEAPLVKDGILLLTCSVLFYLNSQFIRDKWQHLFEGLDDWLAVSQSYIGCITAFLGVWAIFTADATALGWAALMLAAALGKRYLRGSHLFVQAWPLTAAVVLRTAMVNFHLSNLYPQHAAARLVTVPILALVFYFAAWVLSGVDDLRLSLRSIALWTASSMLVALVWCDVAQPWVSPVWVACAAALSLIARRFKLSDLTYQEHLLAAGAAVQLFVCNMDAQSATERYLPMLGCAAAFYAISRFSTQENASYCRPAAWAHTWTATALVAALAWHESPEPWLAVIWAVFALALAAIDRIFTVEELPYQAHLLTLLAVVRAATLNLYTLDKWHGIDLRSITVSILVVVLYAMARWVRLPESMTKSDLRHAYSWVGSSLGAWMLWSELQPISVALGLAIFGLMLFEIGAWQQQKQLRLQAYALLSASFLRIFFVNLTAATLPGEALSPRIYTVAPLALIYFFVWSQLQSDRARPEIGRWSASSLIAYFGTGSVAALLYYQTNPEWIVVAWSILVLALMTAALLLDKEVFLQQAVLLVVGVVARGLAHNIFGASYFVAGGWRGKFSVLLLTAAILFGALPIAFRLRKRYAARPLASLLSRRLALHRPEQFLFFAPVVLIVFMIAVKMNPGMVTLSWGIVGVMVILLGLLVSQRSYRLTGLFLLLLCVGKIVIRDAWNLNERDRYITFIVLGAALTLVSTLYSKYRDTVRRLL